MFKNVGKTIKNISIAFAIIGSIASLIGANIVWNVFYYAVGIGYAVGISFAILFGGVIVSWLVSIVLYGFGELIETSSHIAREVDKLTAREKNTNFVGDNEAYNEARSTILPTSPKNDECPICFTIVKADNKECPCCGYKLK